SGFNELSEYPYHIKGMRKYGSMLLIGSELALWLASRTGISAAPARYDPIVPGVGIYMPYTMTVKQNDILFYGRDHAYLFSGNRALEIMDPVRDIIFFNLEASKIHMNHGIIRPETQEWIGFLTEPGLSLPTVAWVWNFHVDASYKWSFAQAVVCAEIHRQDVARTWLDLSGSWNAQTSE